MFRYRTIRKSRGSLTEFPLVLTVLLLMGIFPLINLTAVAMGAASTSLLAHQAATVASSQRRFDDCLQTMVQESNTFMNSNFAKFLRIQPIGGYQNSGADLYIDASNYRTVGQVQTFAADSPVPPPVDMSTYVYECSVKVTCQFQPFVNLAGVPFIGSVPGIGKPYRLEFRASRAAEFPDGLEGTGGTMGNTGSVSTFDTTPSPNTIPASELGSSGSGWNYPNIYAMIAAAGQTVVTSEVIAVPANLPVPPQPLANEWTSTSVTVAPGQKCWIDLRADGLWTTSIVQPFTNANGTNSYSFSIPSGNPPDINAQPASLIGKVGNSAPFVVGTDLLNYAPGATGPVSLIMDDYAGWAGYTDNIGYQFVRIIVTQ